jgi:hypothetical protein
LGPGAAGNTFASDGGEAIFSLPNGLHAFLLGDRRGGRLDKAPLAIVSDPRRPDRAVENGISCMGCHAGGLIPKVDQVRAHVEKNGNAFTPDEAATVKALYPPEENLSAVLAQDNARCLKALDRAGVPVGGPEPIVTLALRYEQDLNLAGAAAEVGLLVRVAVMDVGRRVSEVLGGAALKTPSCRRRCCLHRGR